MKGQPEARGEMGIQKLTLGVLEVVAPERADLVLASDVPYCEANVLVLDRLDVEAFGGHSA